MTKIIPSKLYKYQSCKSCHSVENLEKKQIWLSNPENLNDPFDCAIPFCFSDPTMEELEAAYNKMLEAVQDKRSANEFGLTEGKPSEKLKDLVNKRAEEGMRKKVEEFSQKGIACFSEVMDSILMWSHYADGHRGFCLEFDTGFEPFQDTNKVHEVIYSNLFPSASPTDVVFLPYMPIDPLITKSVDWHYEREWRMIRDEGDTPYKYDPRALTGIYFGCLMPVEQKNNIASILRGSPTIFYKMKRGETRFNVTWEAIL